MRSIDASRVADMPTDFCVLTGNPSDAASETHAPRRMWTTDSSERTAMRSRTTAEDQTEPELRHKAEPGKRRKTAMAAWLRLDRARSAVLTTHILRAS